MGVVSKKSGQYDLGAFGMRIAKNKIGLLSFLCVSLVVIFEGALTKWFGFPLMFLVALRDGVVLATIFFAISVGALRLSKDYIMVAFCVTLILVLYGIIQYLMSIMGWVSYIVGLRFWLLYMWYVIALFAIFDPADFKFLIRFFLWVAVFMVPLVVFQNMMPPSHYINRQPSGDIDGVFLLADGVVRVSGTFTFTTGYTCLVSFLIPMLYAFDNKYVKMVLFLVMSVLVLLSGSRALLAWFFILHSLVIIFQFVFDRKSSVSKQMVGILVSGLVFVGIISLYFPNMIDAYANRLESAARSEDAGDRLGTMLFGEDFVYDDFTILGKGMGMGSNAVSRLQGSNIKGAFSVGESEPGKVVGELGILGLVVLFLKYFFALNISSWGVKALRMGMGVFPLSVSLTVAYSVLTWPLTGQISAHGVAYMLVAFWVLLYKYISTGDCFENRIIRS
jgi:hypothetical protein